MGQVASVYAPGVAKNPNQLSQTQVDVLEWVRNGCPAGVYTDGWEHRIVARALERRGLVSIGGRGASWIATITTAGRTWLEAPPAAILSEEPDADRLIARVQEAGGSLRITASDTEIRPWERLVRLSLKSSSRPRGKQLAISRVGHAWDSDEWNVSFVTYFDDLVTVRPAPVPQRVTKYHPAVKAYLEHRNWQFVSTDHLSRAGHILQAVAIEAERRGIQVLDPKSAKKHQGQPLYKPIRGHLWLITDFGDYMVEIKEIAGKGGATRDYSRRYDKSEAAWLARRSTEFISTGRLELILDGPLAPYQGEHFRDAKSKTVESRLPEMFATLDVLQLKAEQQERERQRAKEDRQRRWEAAMVEAKAAYVRHERWEHFRTLADDSEKLDHYRRFLESAEGSIRNLPHGEQDVAGEYLAEMRAAIDARDPIFSPTLIVPVVPEPNPKDLTPFLKGWNPYGPER
jgi:hypothetical protein